VKQPRLVKHWEVIRRSTSNVGGLRSEEL
jgi:hypothetical protein